MTKNYSIVISSIRRECTVALCYRDKVVVSNIIDNVTANLILTFNKLLRSQDISLLNINKIAFLSGPGSFTTSRILCAICMAIKQVYPEMVIQPITLDEAIYALESYHNTIILLKCNTHVWHIYEGKWGIINDCDLHIRLVNDLLCKRITSFDFIPNQLEWPNLIECLIKSSDSIQSDREILPFYGV